MFLSLHFLSLEGRLDRNACDPYPVLARERKMRAAILMLEGEGLAQKGPSVRLAGLRSLKFNAGCGAEERAPIQLGRLEY